MRRLGLLIFVVSLFAVPATANAVAPGGFVQLPNPLGCLTATGNAGVCGTFHDFSRSFDMVISPDGNQLYAAGLDSSTLLVFDRNKTTGALTQKPGNQGCIRNGAATATCRSGHDMSGPIGLAVTPNGKTVYLAGYFNNTVATFTRASDGTLTQKAGTQGCIADTASATCRDGRALGTPSFLTISNDGKQLYVGSEGSGSVTALAIDGNGVLTQIDDGPGGAGCVEDVPTVTNGCADGRALAGPFGINAASDSDTIYVATYGDASISALARDSDTGRLSPLPGPTGCIDNASPAKDGCTSDTELTNLRDVVGAPGGKHIYVPVEDNNRVLLFDRQASGGLTVARVALGASPRAWWPGARRAARWRGRRASRSARTATMSMSPARAAAVSSSSNRNQSTGVLTPRSDSTRLRRLIPAGELRDDARRRQPVRREGVAGRQVHLRHVASAARRSASSTATRPPVCRTAARRCRPRARVSLKCPCSDPDGDAIDVTT